MDPAHRKARAAAVSVVSSSCLVLGKVVVGVMTGSVSVISEAIHSAIDLIAAGIALFAVRMANKPADKGHPYGHGKIENISGSVEAILIFLAAVWIVYEGIHKLLARSPVEAPGLGVAVMAVSAVANHVVSRMLFRVARETDSIALQADAWHLRTDVWTSVGVMLGLLVIQVSRWLFPGVDVWWIDPVAAIAVALFIGKAAWDLTRESMRDMLDASLPDEEQRWIAAHLRSVDGARGFHALRTRKAASQRFVDMHLVVDRNLTVETAHQMAGAVGAAIRSRFGHASVTIHVEPCDGRCGAACLEGCLVGGRPPEERAPAP